MAFIAFGHSESHLLIVADPAELAFIHRIHLHLLCALFHRPDGSMAFVALECLCMKLMAESDRCHTRGLVNDWCLWYRRLQMAIRAVGVRECLLTIMAGKT